MKTTFLLKKEGIWRGSVLTLYMRNGFLIYDEKFYVFPVFGGK
jgi:hypothetical protein